MPTELDNKQGETIREKGHEYGTTTGRPRRCGWFDAVVGRYSSDVNGFTSIAIMKFDILDSFATIKICTEYEMDGVRYTRPPANSAFLEQCRPVYEELPGWQSDTSIIRDFDKLPSQARAYIKRIEELLDRHASIISVGPDRKQTIMVKALP